MQLGHMSCLCRSFQGTRMRFSVVHLIMKGNPSSQAPKTTHAESGRWQTTQIADSEGQQVHKQLSTLCCSSYNSNYCSNMQARTERCPEPQTLQGRQLAACNMPCRMASCNDCSTWFDSQMKVTVLTAMSANRGAPPYVHVCLHSVAGSNLGSSTTQPLSGGTSCSSRISAK